MMKKLLVLVLILAFTSAVSATYSVRLEVHPDDLETSYMPDDEITIQVLANFYIGSFGLGGSAAVGEVIGTGVENPPLSGHDAGIPNPAFTMMTYAGIVVNSGGVLFTDAKGTIATFAGMPPLYPDVWIYEFEYLVPDVPASTDITIYASGSIAFMGYETFDPGPPPVFGTICNRSEITATEIHVVPEPMTVALLGIGGLFLRRRK
jgi:hypothetical protein